MILLLNIFNTNNHNSDTNIIENIDIGIVVQ